MSEVAELIERLRNYADDDHERLCKGREYSCTCGYDEKRDPLLADAADTLASQAAEIERLREALGLAGDVYEGLVGVHPAEVTGADRRTAAAIVRICPERDTYCPHGVSCAFTRGRYRCDIDGSRAALNGEKP